MLLHLSFRWLWRIVVSGLPSTRHISEHTLPLLSIRFLRFPVYIDKLLRLDAGRESVFQSSGHPHDPHLQPHPTLSITTGTQKVNVMGGWVTHSFLSTLHFKSELMWQSMDSLIFFSPVQSMEGLRFGSHSICHLISLCI